ARVANQTCAAADDGDRTVSGALHVRKRENDEQRSDVQAGRAGIEPDVAGDLSLSQRVAHAFGRVVHQSAPRQLAEQVHRSLLYSRRLCSSLDAPRSRAWRRLRSARSPAPWPTAWATSGIASRSRRRCFMSQVCHTVSEDDTL